jgi:sugar O-acyltransferase (sialic acid O-acetyltransferase NeuD family)
MKKGIIGAGGFGREVYWSLNPIERNDTVFFVDDEYWDDSDEKILPLSLFESNKYEVIVAVADSKHRQRLVEQLPKKTKFFTHIHPSAQILADDVIIGEGSIICSGAILTTNIILGKHSQLNLQTTIGHDCVIGDYFTTAPGAKISGNCDIGKRVYFGTNSSVREKIKICDDVVIGLNGGVVKNIYESGIYVGVPVTKIKTL